MAALDKQNPPARKGTRWRAVLTRKMEENSSELTPNLPWMDPMSQMANSSGPFKSGKATRLGALRCGADECRWITPEDAEGVKGENTNKG